MQPQSHCRLQFLRIHHETDIACNCEHAIGRSDELGGEGRGEAGAHGGEGVVEEDGVGEVRGVVAGEPELVHAVVEAEDAGGGDGQADVLDCRRRVGLVGEEREEEKKEGKMEINGRKSR